MITTVRTWIGFALGLGTLVLVAASGPLSDTPCPTPLPNAQPSDVSLSDAPFSG